MGGYIIERLDHLPKAGEYVMSDDGIRLVVDSVEKNRIDKVHLYLPEKKTDPEETEEASEG